MKKPPPGTEERIAQMSFASIYPFYLAKVEKKGRTREELHEVIEWLTGYNEKKLQKLIDEDVNFETFFKKMQTESQRAPDQGSHLRLPGGRTGKSPDPANPLPRQVD